jgi:hypothetical protein
MATRSSRFIDGVRISPYFDGPDDNLTYSHRIGMLQIVTLHCDGRWVTCSVAENGQTQVYGLDYSDRAKAYGKLIALGHILRKSVLPPLSSLRLIDRFVEKNFLQSLDDE